MSIPLSFSLQNGIQVRDGIDTSSQMASCGGGPDERNDLPDGRKQMAWMSRCTEERPALQDATPAGCGGEGEEVRPGIDQGDDVWNPQSLHTFDTSHQGFG
jgi:hypothetical protein